MDLMLLRLFQQQVLYQCKFLIRAAVDINAGLAEQDIEHVFFAIQNLLNAAANISKAFWGQGGRLTSERQPLRDSIGLQDTSPLKQVTMRNNFEHFDDRLDTWWAESQNHIFVDFTIGPTGSIVAGPVQSDMFRHFDPQTCDIVFWGQVFNVQALVSEVERILPKLQEEASKPHWAT